MFKKFFPYFGGLMSGIVADVENEVRKIEGDVAADYKKAVNWIENEDGTVTKEVRVFERTVLYDAKTVSRKIDVVVAGFTQTPDITAVVEAIKKAFA